ncbi:threonine/serine exporter ThrE family protein [Oenococcus alcoholitolerans]|uniref:threonine/serine ThrE exporter family protein n=1 Tax=Oenococcus alcoholitolerans TaxID=931074 RepID=UPI003F6FB18F
MVIHWGRFIGNKNNSAGDAPLDEKASLVGRIGILMLSCGTGAWRVREAMNTIARNLGVTCSADIGLISIQYTCFTEDLSYTQVLSLPKTGVNTEKLDIMERFVKDFEQKYASMPVRQIHRLLDDIQRKPGIYSTLQAALGAALACSAFVFLLGGGPIEMICSFVGAGAGNFTRRQLINHKTTTLVCTAAGVAVACVFYLLLLSGLELLFSISRQHEVGYIGAMLFVVPGFPFITSMLDLSKSDMRSGLERLSYALMITIVATLVGWLVALLVHFRPGNFLPLGLTDLEMMLFRIPASFCGVFGFSIMFNSPRNMAILSGLIGAVANTTRLELVDLTNIPAAAAAFIGALTAGILASFINRRTGFPRISLTVPSIVIMVPGLYIYRAVYYIGLNQIGIGGLWLTRSALIIMFLPMGLFVARFIMDKQWRFSD